MGMYMLSRQLDSNYRPQVSDVRGPKDGRKPSASFVYCQEAHAPGHDGAHIPSHGGLHDMNAVVHAASDACHDATQCVCHAYHASYVCQYSEGGSDGGGGTAVCGSSKSKSLGCGSGLGAGALPQLVSGGFRYSSSYLAKSDDV